jgi:hypothetical protein
MVSGGWAFGRTPLRRWVGTRLAGDGRGVVVPDGMVPDGMVPDGMIKTGHGDRAVTAGNGCREWSLVGGRSAERPYGDGWAHDWLGMDAGWWSLTG